MSETVTLQLPERLHQRLVKTAEATQRTLESVIIHALTVGSPPDWDDAPEEFQATLAALDRLEDSALWEIARSRKPVADMERYDKLLELNQANTITDSERLELFDLREESEHFMLKKAHAAAILKWRRHQIAAA